MARLAEPFALPNRGSQQTRRLSVLALAWQLSYAPARRGLAVEMGRTRHRAGFEALTQLCTDGAVGLQAGQQALTRVAVIMAAKGRRGRRRQRR